MRPSRLTFRIPYTVAHREVAEFTVEGTSEAEMVSEVIQKVRDRVPNAIIGDPELVNLERLS